MLTELMAESDSAKACAVFAKPPMAAQLTRRRQRIKKILDGGEELDEDGDPGFKLPVPRIGWRERIIDHQTEDEFLNNPGVSGNKVEQGDGVYYLNDDSQKVILPESLHEEIIRKYHNMGHYGKRLTRNAVAKMYTWRGLTRDVANLVKSYLRAFAKDETWLYVYLNHDG